MNLEKLISPYTLKGFYKAYNNPHKGFVKLPYDAGILYTEIKELYKNFHDFIRNRIIRVAFLHPTVYSQ